jgi:hypothetical protein
MVKLAAELADPPPVVTLTLPDVAPAGITNFSDVEVAPAETVTAVEPIVTVAPSKLVPFRVTTVTPFLPVVGVNDVTVGAGGVTVKEAVLTTPAPVVILIAPVSAPVGTTTVSVLPVLITGFADLLPAKITLVAFKFDPVMVTV